ncbi:reverse transcriptase domain-containing protein [Tanacetum coccineum]
MAEGGYSMTGEISHMDIQSGAGKKRERKLENIRMNLEAYVDDMVIKSNDEKMLLADVAETFDNLRRINMKLNLKKCSFGVEEGKFLGYMVTSEGIQANLKKMKAIADMQSPRTLKEIQSLSGKLAALNRYLARSAERSLPFFDTLKSITKENMDEYWWTEEAEKSFQEMKKVIMEFPLLTTLKKEEMMYVYLASATEARNYAPLEKLALSLLHMSRRLRRYFEAHPIKVISDQPIKQILSKVQVSGKLAKYSIELGSYNITYEPRNAIKGQVLADFLSEAPVGTKSEGSGAGLVLISPSGMEFTYALCLNFTRTNNEVAYEALVAGLRLAAKMQVQAIDVKANYVIREIHMGACEMHYGTRSVVAKVIRRGYYWPTMHIDAVNEIWKRDSCQIHAPVPKLLKTLMTSIMALWPFYQ